MKQEMDLILMLLNSAGTCSDVMWSLKWEETGRPEQKRVRTGDHPTLSSHTPWRGSNPGRSDGKRYPNTQV